MNGSCNWNASRTAFARDGGAPLRIQTRERLCRMRPRCRRVSLLSGAAELRFDVCRAHHTVELELDVSRIALPDTKRDALHDLRHFPDRIALQRRLRRVLHGD